MEDVLHPEQATNLDSQPNNRNEGFGEQSRDHMVGGQKTNEVHNSTLRDATVLESRSPSDTEAEDEFQKYLKALPAAVKHPRKGLRSRQEERLAFGDSPFLTPSQLENDDKDPQTEYFSRQGDHSSPSSSREEAVVTKAKFRRRRRAELLRRASELLSLSLLCAAVLLDEAVYTMARLISSGKSLAYTSSTMTV